MSWSNEKRKPKQINNPTNKHTEKIRYADRQTDRPI